MRQVDEMLEKSVVRLIGAVDSERFGAHLATVCAAQGATIKRIDAANPVAVEQVASGPVEAEQWRIKGPFEAYSLLRELLPWAREEGAIVILSRSARPVRTALFDLDATLTTCEFLDALADELSIGDRTRELTRAAMAGETDFAESYRTRLKLFAGTPLTRIDAVIARLQLTDGAKKMFETLCQHAIPTAIVTGGDAHVGRAIQRRLGTDALYATELEEVDGKLTGQITGKLLDETAKVRALDDFCIKNGCRPAECAAVGDGANDLRMLATAGHAVLYSAMPENPSRRQSIDRILDFLELAGQK